MVSSSSSSSDSDSEEAERLRSVAIDSSSVTRAAVHSNKNNRKTKENHAFSDGESGAPVLKFYQTKAQELLKKYLDETFETKPLDEGTLEKNDNTSKEYVDTAFQLFRTAPPGLVEKRHCGEEVASSKRKQVEDVDEDSEMFQSSILAAAVDGVAVKEVAEKAASKALMSWLSRQAAQKEAQKKEEERIKLLKAQRGEKWLPSVAKSIATDKFFDEQLLNRVANARNQKANLNMVMNQPKVALAVLMDGITMDMDKKKGKKERNGC